MRKYTWPQTVLHSLIHELSLVKQQNDKLNTESVRLRDSNLRLKNSEKDLTKKLEQLAKEAEKVIQQKNKENIALEARLKQSKNETQHLLEFSEKKTKELQELSQGYNQLKELSEQLCRNKDKELSENSKKIEDLNKQLSLVVAEKNKEKASLVETFSKEVAKLNKKNKELENSLAETNNRLEQEKQKSEELNKKNIQMKNALSEKSSVIDYWKKQNISLQELVKEQGQVNVQQGYKYLESEMKNKDLLNDIESLKKKNEDTLKMFYALQEFYSTLLVNDYSFSEIKDVKVKPEFLKSLKQNKIHIPQDVWLKISEDNKQEESVQVVLNSNIVHHTSETEVSSKLGNKILFGLLLIGLLFVLYLGFQV